jgi:2,4-diaminopentanoate dehydrogenase
MTIQVVQWTTGVVGKAAARGIIRNPAMRLVGCYTQTSDKVGKDVGTLCAVEPIGVAATDDIEALLALKPDCVAYMPQFPNVSHMVRLLEAGCNIVSTAYFINGTAFGAQDLARIEAAAQKGGVSIYGSGINPGLANVLALVATAGCARIDRISVLESVDSTPYASPGTWTAVGFGRPVTDPEVPGITERMMPSFREAVGMMADALKFRLDDIRYSVEFAAATENVDLGYMTIGKGCISGLRGCWSGFVGTKAVIELRFAWKLGNKLTPDWPIEDGYLIEIYGEPNIRCRYEPIGTHVFDSGLITAMPTINAIPAVCAARPGIVTAADLPIVTGAGLVSAGRAILAASALEFDGTSGGVQ